MTRTPSVLANNIVLIRFLMSLTFFFSPSHPPCLPPASSKAERPPSLSLYPNVEGMVRGGHGGARMMPGKDIWQVSKLGQATLSSAHQVGQTAPPPTPNPQPLLQPGEWKGEGPPYCCQSHQPRPHGPQPPLTPACVAFFPFSFKALLLVNLTNLFKSHIAIL